MDDIYPHSTLPQHQALFLKSSHANAGRFREAFFSRENRELADGGQLSAKPGSCGRKAQVHGDGFLPPQREISARRSEMNSVSETFRRFIFDIQALHENRHFLRAHVPRGRQKSKRERFYSTMS
jgi:hypothetical protein